MVVVDVVVVVVGWLWLVVVGVVGVVGYLLWLVICSGWCGWLVVHWCGCYCCGHTLTFFMHSPTTPPPLPISLATKMFSIGTLAPSFGELFSHPRFSCDAATRGGTVF